MSNDPPRIVLFFRSRGVLFWALTITAVSVLVLLGGSQIAHDRGQTVDWYTGFGQWLGALGSFVAAGAALWISVSDRRHATADRDRIEAQHDADLIRQADLVRVSAEMLGRRQAVGASFPAPCIAIRNRRSDRICEIEVVKFVHHGEELELEIGMVNGWAVVPRRPEHEAHFPMKASLTGIALASDEILVLYQQGSLPDTPADYAAVRYTDTAGRRWEVDTDGAVTRL